MLRSITQENFFYKVGAKLYGIYNADPTTDFLSLGSHGFENDDIVQFVNTGGGELPGGLSLLTTYYVLNKTADTFQVSETKGGDAVDITDAGSGENRAVLKCKGIIVAKSKHNILTIASSGNANFKPMVQGSEQEDVDFNAAQSATNRWEYIMIKDLQDNSTIAGDTGITGFSGSDDVRMFEINTNATYIVNVVMTSIVAGSLNATLRSYDNK